MDRTPLRVLVGFLILLASSLTTGHRALAQTNIDAARGAESRARDAFARGEYVAAARAFAEANVHAPHGATRYNEALSWDKAGELERTADAYAAALTARDNEGTLAPAQAQAARERLSTLRLQLGRILVTGPEGAHVSVGHAVALPLPAEIHLSAGTHQIVLEVAGETVTTTTATVAAAQVLPVALTLPASDKIKEVARVPDAPREKAEMADTANPGPDESRDVRKLVAYAALGAGVAVGIAAVVLGVKTLGTIDDFKATGNTDVDLHERAGTQKVTTNVLTGIAVALGAAGTVLWLTAPDSREAKQDAKQAAKQAAKQDAVKVSVRVIGPGAELSVRF